MFFQVRFRARFLIALLMENGSKMAPKIHPRGDLFDQNGAKRRSPPVKVERPGADFFRGSNFQCHFGTILVNFAPFWVHFGTLWTPFGSILDALGSILHAFPPFGHVVGQIWNRFPQGRFFRHYLVANPQTNPPTNHKATNP